VGLCGSGLVDAVAALVGAGMIEHRPFVLEASDRFGKIGEENIFYLSDDTISHSATCGLQFARHRSRRWAILGAELGTSRGRFSQVLLEARSAPIYGRRVREARPRAEAALERIVAAATVAGERREDRALRGTERAAANAGLEEVE